MNVSLPLLQIEEPRIVFEGATPVWRTLGAYRQTNETRKATIDSPDAPILNCAKRTAVRNAVEFNGFYILDKAAQRLAGALELRKSANH